MEELTAILQAASRRISASYFCVPIDGGPAVYRERVYCYELYHQMRCEWPKRSPYLLNGELSKAAHPVLSQRDIAACPDLLVHMPGSMAGNHAVIEVKSARATVDGIQKDLQTLSDFVRRADYARAIYLLFGTDLAQAVGRTERIAARMEGLPPIELWLHDAPDQPATQRATLGNA